MRTRLSTLSRKLVLVWREIARELTDSYRPELHYMRGPGPRSQERRQASPKTRPAARKR